MSFRFTNQYFTFKKVIESKENERGKSAKVSMSSSWKDASGKRHYSDWVAVFSGDSLEVLSGLEKGDFIKCTGTCTRERYETPEKSGWAERMYVFECSKWKKESDISLPVASPDIDAQEDEFPF